MVKNSNFRKFFLPVDSLDSGDSESLGYKIFFEFRKKNSRSLNHCTASWWGVELDLGISSSTSFPIKHISYVT